MLILSYSSGSSREELKKLVESAAPRALDGSIDFFQRFKSAAS